jgi:hypothetical protein
VIAGNPEFADPNRVKKRRRNGRNAQPQRKRTPLGKKKKRKKRPNHPHKIIEADTIRLASVQGQDPEI